MTNSEHITIGYDYDMWYDYGQKSPIRIDFSTKSNRQILCCGMSGAGKSYYTLRLIGAIVQALPNSEIYFADYKQEDDFIFLRSCPRYYPYKKVTEALEIVYNKMQNRQSGEDKSRHPVILVFDEYIAYILSLQSIDKKTASNMMNKISEILMLGRSLNVKMLISCQRPDAAAFPTGSRLNFGVIAILGNTPKSTYEMLLPSAEYIEAIGERKFRQGEGIVLLQGVDLHFIKVPTIYDMGKLQELCIKGLS